LAGGLIDRAGVAALSPARQRGPRIDTLRVQGVAEGAPMPSAWGRMRVTGQVIWAARFMEQRHKKSAGKGGPRTVEHDYSLSFAVALGEGPIDGIGRIWADGQPFDQSGVAMRLYRGGDSQMPDALIQAVEGSAPAYRGVAYVVFEDLPLGPFGNRPPQLSFEVFRRPRGAAPRLEDMLEGVCLIPGAGEFALATEVVMRRESLTRATPENMNNLEGRPDLLVSLDQLEATFPNLKRVSLVVGWFGDDLRAGQCRVRPGVERVDKPTTPMDWRVAGIGREDAHVISSAGSGPAYGGTPSDDSVRQAIRALKARGWAVTLYPFVFMDVPQGNGLPDPYGGDEQAPYPWRGRIVGAGGSAAAGEVSALFGEIDSWGLRRMARHYAAIAVEEGADGLLIGSEMRGVTTIRDAGGGYPAVTALRALAAECRVIVGSDVALSYAADWSEYFGHQPTDGSGDVMFHLDPLWADPNIDYVGIDWYPPMGDWREGAAHLDAMAGHSGGADPAYLAQQVAGGEQVDWYYADDEARAGQARQVIIDGAYGEAWVYRPKDLKSWWSSPHHNRPGGVRAVSPTGWVPGMKPVRLTEFGCAAVDKGGNAPNLFQDPKSSESHLPPFSTGARDDAMQRRLLEAVIGHFLEPANNPVSPVYGGPMLAAMDAWCWDARPYPDFPARASVWSDAGNWNAGHWLNGRAFGEAADLIAAILKRGGLSESDFAIEGVSGAVDQIAIDRPMRIRDGLEPLIEALDLTMSEQGGRVTVAGAGVGAASLGRDAVALSDKGAGLTTMRRLEAPPETARVRFIDAAADYQTGSVVVRGDQTGGGEAGLDLPMACGAELARAAARRAVQDGAVDGAQVNVGPLDALRLEAGDRLVVEGLDGGWRIERVDADERPRLTLARLVEDDGVDSEGAPIWRPTPPPSVTPAPVLRILDLPPLPGDDSDRRPIAAVAADPWRPMAVYGGSSVLGLRERARVMAPATVGRLVAPLAPARSHRWDEVSRLDVVWDGPAPSSTDAQTVLAGANAVAVETTLGLEILQFRNAAPLGNGVWRLSGLLRGQQGTENEAASGAQPGGWVAVIEAGLARLDVQDGELGLPLIWRAGPLGAPPGGVGVTEVEAVWTGRYARPWRPASLAVRPRPDGLAISWNARNRLNGDRWDGEVEASDPMRFRVRVMDGAAVVRAWEVEGQTTLYPLAQVTADAVSLDGRIGVSQWSPLVGWGDEAVQALN
jgi:hypothetical protein